MNLRRLYVILMSYSKVANISILNSFVKLVYVIPVLATARPMIRKISIINLFIIRNRSHQLINILKYVFVLSHISLRLFFKDIIITAVYDLLALARRDDDVDMLSF